MAIEAENELRLARTALGADHFDQLVALLRAPLVEPGNDADERRPSAPPVALVRRESARTVFADLQQSRGLGDALAFGALAIVPPVGGEEARDRESHARQRQQSHDVV